MRLAELRSPALDRKMELRRVDCSLPFAKIPHDYCRNPTHAKSNRGEAHWHPPQVSQAQASSHRSAERAGIDRAWRREQDEWWPCARHNKMPERLPAGLARKARTTKLNARFSILAALPHRLQRDR